MKKLLLANMLLLVLTGHSIAQQFITGKVFSSAGVAVEGATITINDSTHAITGRNGIFSVKADRAGDVLTVSSVGYETQYISLKGKDRTNLQVTLATVIKTLEEVTVNTGYQYLPKERATGSFDKIDNALLNRAVSTDVLSRLEGVASSVYFSKELGTPQLFIRGLSTLSSDITAPLVVLDNFPYEGDISNINPNDVESITILKDAAAASIWGARAGNGVIVISTKKGRFNQPLKVSFNSNVTIQQKPDLLGDPNSLPPSDFIDLEEFLFKQGQYDADLEDIYYRPIISPVVEILAKERAGTISSADAEAQINVLRGYNLKKDYLKYLYRPAENQQYAIGLTGGTNNINYFINAGFDHNISNDVGDKNQRFTLSTLTNIKPLQWLNIGLGINATFTDVTNNSLGYVQPSYNRSAYYPYARLADANGNPSKLEKDYRTSYLDTAGHGLLEDWSYSPLTDQRLNDRTSSQQDYLFKMDVTARLTRALSLQLAGQLEKMYTDGRTFYHPDSYYSRNIYNSFTQVNADGTISHIAPPGGILDNSHDLLNAYALRTQLSFDKQWRSRHRLNAIAGAEVRQTHTTSQSGREYGYDNNSLTFQQVDYLNAYSFYDGLGFSQLENRADLEDQQHRYFSLYANAAYTYDNRYTFSASARRDASNLFGVNTNHQWNPLWSAGIAWDINNEDFYHFRLLPKLRLRLTYGSSGNIRDDVSALATIFYYPAYYPTNLPSASVDHIPDANLRWEKTKTFNAGIDFSGRNDRISGSIEYYTKRGLDLFGFTKTDITAGVGVVNLNSADLSGHGIDVKLDVTITNAPVKWQVQALFSYVTNKVTRYGTEFSNKGDYTGGGYTLTPIAGKNPYAVISYKWGGLDTAGNPTGFVEGKRSTDYNALTNVSDFNDLVISGTTRPPYYGYLRNIISWRGISLSANVGFKFGYVFRRNSLNYSSLIRTWAGGYEEFSRRWQKPGDEAFTNVPSLVYPADPSRDQFYQYSETTVEKGDHIRIQEITAGYNLGKTKLARLRFSDLGLYIYLNNIGVIWRANHDHIDPDYGNGIPAPLSLAIGVKAGF